MTNDRAMPAFIVEDMDGADVEERGVVFGDFQQQEKLSVLMRAYT